MNARIRCCVAAGGILLAMNVVGRLSGWLGWTGGTGPGAEIRIRGCLAVKGCRFAVYRAATSHGARCVTSCIKDAISSQDGDLVIKLGFQDDFVRGQFIDKVLTWCEVHNLDEPELRLVDRVRLGNSISVCDYIPNETTSPPGARSASRSRSSQESFRTDATEIVGNKSELCRYQSLEAPDFNQKDSCHLIPHSKCRGTPIDKDSSNRIACSTRFHRAFDGLSEQDPPWVRIAVKDIDTQPVECKGVGETMHFRYRVNLYISFLTAEHRSHHGFIWKDGTKDDGKNPVETYVHVRDFVVFENGVESKYLETTGKWASSGI